MRPRLSPIYQANTGLLQDLPKISLADSFAEELF